MIKRADIATLTKGTAIAADIPSAKTAFVDGLKVTGTASFRDMPSSPTVWFDASQLTGLSDGDGVSSWTDLSGNGYHATQSTTDYKPLYKTNIQNGLPVVRFDGSNDVLGISGSASTLKFLHSTDSTIFAVAKFGTSSNPDALYTLLGSCASTGGKIGITLWYDDRSSQSRNDKLVCLTANGTDTVTNNVSADGFVSANSFHIIGTMLNNDAATPAGRTMINCDGGNLIDNNIGTQSSSSSDSTHDLQIGANGNNALYMLGDVGEVIIYNKMLKAKEIGNILNYLSNKWSITLA